MNIKEFHESAKSFYLKCKRVWLVLKKPTRKEFEVVAKVSAIGILIVGFVGFVISMIVNLFF
ncbi:MAG: protein translocase SEC61 complex subunit gamma [archaeon]